MTIARYAERQKPRTDVLAWGNKDPETGCMPIYHADGSLWFVMTGLGIEQEADGSATPEYVGRMLHRMADKVNAPARCYFIGGEDGAIKIGFAVKPADRLRTIQACSPVKLSVLATAGGGREREVAYHTQFAAHRLHGEWFERHPDILAEIARLNSSDRREA